MRSLHCLSTLVFAAMLVGSSAMAGEAGHPGTGTSGPPVLLGAEQLRAIATKGVPNVTAPVAAVPATRVAGGKVVPVLASRETPAASAASPRPLKLPTISPAIGPLPRPEWSLPPELRKQPDYAVIGTRRVMVGAAAGGAAVSRAPAARIGTRLS